MTLYLYETDEDFNFRFLRNEALNEASGLHLAIDTQSDFELASKIIKLLIPDHRDYNWIEISKLALNEKYMAG